MDGYKFKRVVLTTENIKLCVNNIEQKAIFLYFILIECIIFEKY